MRDVTLLVLTFVWWHLSVSARRASRSVDRRGFFEDSAAEPAEALGRPAFFASLLPAGADAAERKVRREIAEGPLQVHLVEQHHQVLNWWIRVGHSAVEPRAGDTEPRKPPARRMVVHVDSHSDIGVANWTEVTAEARRGGRAGLAKWMVDNVDFGNFIAPAAMAGIVTDVIWLRSSFAHCTYNGPHPGSYIVGLYLSEDEETICQKIISREKRDSDDEDLKIDYDSFGTCSGPLQADPLATFRLTVATQAFLQRDVEALGGVPDEWVLDVDEDYFASYIPGWHNLVHFLKRDFSDDQLQRIRSTLTEVGDACETDDHGSDFFKLMEKLPAQWNHEEAWSKWEENVDCTPPAELKDHLKKLVKDFTGAQSGSWTKGWQYMRKDTYAGSDTEFIFSSGCIMPESVPTPEELQEALKDFEGSVKMLTEAWGPPRLVDVCRSVLNGYLPKNIWPSTEAGVKGLLRNALHNEQLPFVPDPGNPPETLYKNAAE